MPIITPDFKFLRPYFSHGLWLVALPYIFIVFSSPMPISYGWSEVLVGAGLVSGWGYSFFRLLASDIWRDKWRLSVFALLLYVLLVSSWIGVANSNSIQDILRDIVPFLFLTFPFIYVLSDTTHKESGTLLTFAILLVGVISASQFYEMIVDRMGSSAHWISNMQAGLLSALSAPPVAVMKDLDVVMRNHIIKIYDPAVLFTTIYLLCFGFKELFSKAGARSLGAVSICLGAFCFYCFMIIGLRAHAGLVLLSFFAFSFLLSIRDSRYRNTMLLVIPLGALVVYPFLKNAIHLMFVKQLSVGTNGKLDEWAAVIDLIFSKKACFWGIGWGGLVDNPVTAGKSRFTHSMLSFYLLKTGLVGLVAMGGAFFLVMRRKAMSTVVGDPDKLLILLSCLAPILIGVLFQPSYKMLSFALILTLLFMAIPDRKPEST